MEIIFVVIRKVTSLIYFRFFIFNNVLIYLITYQTDQDRKLLLKKRIIFPNLVMSRNFKISCKTKTKICRFNIR